MSFTKEKDLSTGRLILSFKKMYVEADWSILDEASNVLE